MTEKLKCCVCEREFLSIQLDDSCPYCKAETLQAKVEELERDRDEWKLVADTYADAVREVEELEAEAVIDAKIIKHQTKRIYKLRSALQRAQKKSPVGRNSPGA